MVKRARSQRSFERTHVQLSQDGNQINARTTIDEDAIIETGASYDERVFGEWSWSLIGLCRFALGEDVAAADAFRRAERYAPGDASYVVRRRLAEARAGTSV